MKILWVKHGKLFPVDAGGKIRTYHILRHLASRHDLTFASSYSGKEDRAYEAELRSNFPHCFSTCTEAPDDSDDVGLQARHYLARAAKLAPYAVTKFTSPRIRQIVKEKLDRHEFDVAVCDFLAVSLDFPKTLAIPTILFQHNVETLLWERQARCERRWIQKIVFTLEAAKMKRYEKATLRRFHHIIAVSESDARLMSEAAEGRITVVPTGVDVRGFQSVCSEIPRGHTVTFLGSMDWEPNVDAVHYFCQQIWPQVLAEIPDSRFMIVGRNPHPSVRKLASGSVTVTGTVSSVIDYLKAAAVVVVPLRVGGGTRLKIFEAMAAGRPVVSTSIGAEGLDVKHGHDILLSDSPSEFAHWIVRLVRDEGLRKRIGAQGAHTASQYDWSVIASQFEQVLARIAGFSKATQHPSREAASAGA
jgi:glycosyltransferase involved in cell wall biosynthesis